MESRMKDSLTKADVEMLIKANSALIAEYDLLIEDFRAGLDSLHVTLTRLKAVEQEVYSLPGPQARALINAVQNKINSLATVYGHVVTAAGAAGFQFPEWGHEWRSGKAAERKEE